MTRLEELKLKDFDALTEVEQEELFDLIVDRDAKEIIENQFVEILNEAEARIWFNRNTIGTELEKPGIKEEIRQGALEAVKKYKEKYNLTEEEIDDFYHGYWSGILALARYLTGYYGTNIEDLRTGDNGLLDS